MLHRKILFLYGRKFYFQSPLICGGITLEVHDIKNIPPIQIKKYLIPLANHLNLSLRQLEKTFTNLVIIFTTTGDNFSRPMPIIVFISVVKAINPIVFEKLMRGKISILDIFKEFKFPEPFDSEDPKFIYLLHNLRYALLNTKDYECVGEKDPVKTIEQDREYRSLSRKKIIPMFCEILNSFSIN